MDTDFDDEPEQPPQSFLRRYRIAISVTGVVLAGIIVLAKVAMNSGGSSKRDSITLVSLAPPPPPPPSAATSSAATGRTKNGSADDQRGSAEGSAAEE